VRCQRHIGWLSMYRKADRKLWAIVKALLSRWLSCIDFGDTGSNLGLNICCSLCFS
jgi:hypothetical protein